MQAPTPPPMNDDDTVLDTQTLALLCDAVPAEALEPERAQRVKHRVMTRIAESQLPQHLTVAADDGAWQPLGPGLTMKKLHRDGGILSYLVRLAPGAMLPPHRHPVDEECVVLEGRVQIGGLDLGAGSFHLGRKDVLHTHIVSEGGALIFLRGAAPHPTALI